jgi:hypothetical protein
MGGCGLDSPTSVGSGEYRNKLSGFMTGRNFIELFRDYKVLKKHGVIYVVNSLIYSTIHNNKIMTFRALNRAILYLVYRFNFVGFGVFTAVTMKNVVF